MGKGAGDGMRWPYGDGAGVAVREDGRSPSLTRRDEGEDEDEDADKPRAPGHEADVRCMDMDRSDPTPAPCASGSSPMNSGRGT